MENKKSFDTDGKAGIFYMVPNLKDKKYNVWAQVEDESEPDPIHLNLWDQVSKSLQMKSHSSEGAFDPYYTGIPRGRVIQHGSKWIIGHGNDFPLNEYKSEILREFNLEHADSASNVLFEVQNHEKMHPGSKKVVENLMNIQMMPSGFKMLQKKKQHKHSENCQICKIL